MVLVLSRRSTPCFGSGAVALAVLALLGACSGNDHPPLVPETPGSGGSGGGPTSDACSPVPAQTDPRALGLCGSLLLPALGDPSNLYFLIDRSGSMGDKVDGVQKYDAVATAAVALVRDLGARVFVGGAVFPSLPDPFLPLANQDPCLVGGEVFPARRGDWPSAARCGDGETTRGFSSAISLPSYWNPIGGTPIAATLAKISSTLTVLADGRRTYLVIATDGGPNCNSFAICDQSSCIPNIERNTGCDPNVNCCAVGAVAGPGGCLDGDATLTQIATLYERGVSTYLIGIPGSGPYAALLNKMAVAGGTARATDPKYYDVPNLSELTQVLASIATEVILTCNFVLQDPPDIPDKVNVYLDRQQVLYDAQNGWTWRPVAGGADGGADDAGAETGSDDASPIDDSEAGPPALDYMRFDLHGAACDKLMSGQVNELLVAFGCPTVLIK